MAISLVIVTLAAFLVMIECAVLALHPCYHSGLLGSCGLGMVAMGALARLMQIFETHNVMVVTPIALFVWVGLAMWFSHILIRFLRRLRKRGSTGWYEGNGAKLA